MKHGHADARKEQQENKHCVRRRHSHKAHWNCGAGGCQDNKDTQAHPVCQYADKRIQQRRYLHHGGKCPGAGKGHGKFFYEQRQKGREKRGIDVMDEMRGRQQQDFSGSETGMIFHLSDNERGSDLGTHRVVMCQTPVFRHG